jgi:hypothetical protein
MHGDAPGRKVAGVKLRATYSINMMLVIFSVKRLVTQRSFELVGEVTKGAVADPDLVAVPVVAYCRA